LVRAKLNIPVNPPSATSARHMSENTGSGHRHHKSSSASGSNCFNVTP
jgi:hypothetical protein